MEGNHNSGARISAQGEKNGKRIGVLLKEYRAAGFIMLVLVVAVVALWPVPDVKCKTTTAGRQPIRWRRLGPNESRFFIDNQVIVTGPAFKVNRVVGSYISSRNRGTDGDLELIRKCDVRYLSEPSGLKMNPRHFTFLERVLGRMPTMRLYHVPDGREEDVIDAINEAAKGGVSADYNLLVGTSQGVCGSPHSSEGSPFGGAPKPLEGEEDPVSLFWYQWAFEHVGVGPFLPDEPAGATTMQQGEGVIVGVFDTSPFDDAEDGWETVKWVNAATVTEPLTLKVSYPEVMNNVEITPSNGSAGAGTDAPDDVRDHGLFVAGLVHAVAPASELHLIRVLDEDGCGDLFLLNEALAQFINEVEDESKDIGRTLEGVVINLSLGVHDPEEGVILDGCSPGGSENEIESLCTTLSSAYSQGAVIVAAAGNRPYSEAEAGTDSDNEDEPQSAQIPAVYEFVIGVKASNVYGNSACFSYDGDVSAPGGEGDVANGCAPNVDGCSGPCDDAIIGLVLSPPEDSDYWPTHYAYWSGTSFSTPLVSGLAAVVLQAGLAQSNEGDVTATTLQNPDWVATAIYSCTVPPPDGVIHTPSTLIDCLPTCLPSPP